MSEDTTAPQTPAENTTMPMVVYVLYLVGFLTGITALIGLILAYVNRSEASAWLQTHYTFQIRTFWIGLGLLVLGFILSFILIGVLVYLFWLIWTIVRCAKGLSLLNQRQPIADPESWMFG
ncbi:hypothetical protein CAI21_05580 [Alkalilimnicola ehrlichii]|uniref:Transmembrane protein n=1 Tax=Alkalilimnicola ehrlichii TaxID=351052 RepID=A0A3E0X1N2_9GAMM|nr:hypothetical protein [Alkalilimnicola ehrlichii]RFA30518.1 hypothetical protein CAI21_05580 [Alkalilimnicola ehrlichii]RFA38067.1 hypothetical protein CAL65_06950 [Alkalilimnicola ehrlichii]